MFVLDSITQDTILSITEPLKLFGKRWIEIWFLKGVKLHVQFCFKTLCKNSVNRDTKIKCVLCKGFYFISLFSRGGGGTIA